MESGETLDEAVRREVLEETGLRVKPARLFCIFERILRDADGRAEYHYLLADYVCTVVGGKLCAGDDSSRAVWARRAELSRYKLTAGTQEVIEAAFDEKPPYRTAAYTSVSEAAAPQIGLNARRKRT